MNCPFCQTDNPRGTPRCSKCRGVLERTVAAGTVIAGRYEVRFPLGRGGMSIVYEALDRERGETVALKVMQPGIGALPEMERRFATEIPLAGRIRQANVCRIYGCGEDDGLRYIAMEKVDGEDLAHALARQGPFPPEEAFDVAIQIGRGIQALHAVGILHRDIKPKNIMYGSDGRVRLMDFDIARQCASGESIDTDAGFGTPEYASPEQALGGAVDFRSDIYSLGIVIFELFAGAVPFRASTSVETVRLHIRAPVPVEGPDAPALPSPLIPILRKALAKEPEQRYKNMRRVVEALRLAQAMTRPGSLSNVAPLRRRARASPTAPTVQRPGLVPDLSQAVPALLSALNEKDQTVRWTRSVKAAPLDAYARDAICALLETLSTRTDPIAPPPPDATSTTAPIPRDGTVGALIATLERESSEERARAALALGDAGASAMVAMPALLRALEDRSAEVRRLAAAALGKIVAAR